MGGGWVGECGGGRIHRNAWLCTKLFCSKNVSLMRRGTAGAPDGSMGA